MPGKVNITRFCQVENSYSSTLCTSPEVLSNLVTASEQLQSRRSFGANMAKVAEKLSTTPPADGGTAPSDLQDTIVYVAGSPWSVKLLWALEVAQSSYSPTIVDKFNVVPDSPLQQKLADLRTRGIKKSYPLFLDVSNDKVVKDSFGTAQYVVSQHDINVSPLNGFSKLLLEKTEELKQWDELADRLMIFARWMLGQNKDNLGKYFAPKYMSYIPFITGRLSRKFLKNLLKKYQDVPVPSIEEIKSILQKVNEALEGKQYLVQDTFSMADIAIAVALENIAAEMFDPPISMGALAPKTSRWGRRLFQYEENYPNLLPFKSRILKEHLSTKTIELVKRKTTIPVRPF